MTKGDILQSISADFSKIIKKYASGLKKLPQKDKNAVYDMMIEFKDKLDYLTENEEISRLDKNELQRMIVEEYKLNESNVFSSFKAAEKEAQKISSEEGVVQHVNKISNKKYKVEDWFDSDTTVVTYVNGELN